MLQRTLLSRNLLLPRSHVSNIISFATNASIRQLSIKVMASEQAKRLSKEDYEALLKYSACDVCTSPKIFFGAKEFHVPLLFNLYSYTVDLLCDLYQISDALLKLKVPGAGFLADICKWYTHYMAFYISYVAFEFDPCVHLKMLWARKVELSSM